MESRLATIRISSRFYSDSDTPFSLKRGGWEPIAKLQAVRWLPLISTVMVTWTCSWAGTSINLTNKTTGILYELEVAHIYIEQIDNQIAELEQQNSDLEARLMALEEALGNASAPAREDQGVDPLHHPTAKDCRGT